MVLGAFADARNDYQYDAHAMSLLAENFEKMFQQVRNRISSFLDAAMFVSKHNGLISAYSLYFIDQFKDRKRLNQKSLRSSQLSSFINIFSSKFPARIYNLKQISRETFNFHGYDIHKYKKILIPHTFSILNISIIILVRNDNF